MIQDTKAQTLFVDFGKTGESVIDVDGLHVDDNGFLFLIEVKNNGFTKSERTARQRELMQGIVDNYAKGGAILFILHDCKHQDGCDSVDMSKYPVTGIYLDGNWFTPKRAIGLHEAMDSIRIYEHNKV